MQPGNWFRVVGEKFDETEEKQEDRQNGGRVVDQGLEKDFPRAVPEGSYHGLREKGGMEQQSRAGFIRVRVDFVHLMYLLGEKIVLNNQVQMEG